MKIISFCRSKCVIKHFTVSHCTTTLVKNKKIWYFAAVKKCLFLNK